MQAIAISVRNSIRNVALGRAVSLNSITAMKRSYFPRDALDCSFDNLEGEMNILQHRTVRYFDIAQLAIVYHFRNRNTSQVSVIIYIMNSVVSPYVKLASDMIKMNST